MSACGTPKGWLGHKSRNEPPCVFCRRAVESPTPTPVKVAAVVRVAKSPAVRAPSVPGVKPPCGTYNGYNWHQRHNDSRCDECWEAAAKYQRDRYVPSTRALVQCGTYQGRRKHHRNNEPVCEPCRQAPGPTRKARNG